MSQCTYIQDRLVYRFRDDFGYIVVEALSFENGYTHIEIRYLFYSTKKRYRTFQIKFTKKKISYGIIFNHYPTYETN